MTGQVLDAGARTRSPGLSRQADKSADATGRKAYRMPRKRMSKKSQKNEEPLLPRVAEGDPSAFQECVDRYKSLLWWLARKWVGADAEDAVQEVFVHIWKNAGRFDPSKASEQTFVAMIARRRLIDMYRSADRKPKSDALDDHQSLVGQRPETIEASADATLAWEAMNSELNEKERRILRLSIEQGMSHSEIASHCDMPLGTVKTYIRRSLGRIRERLNQSDAPSLSQGSGTGSRS